MTSAPEDEDRLARLLDGVLRDLELRRAPPTLESRVLAQIARRRNDPWMLRSFRHWPPGARAIFLVLSCALIGILVAGVPAMPFPLPSLARLDPLTSGAWLQSLLASFASATALVDAAPAGWLRGILVAAAGLYAALFGLGAAAYRLLYLPTRVART